ncbi:hypothetical protein SAMN05216191_10959 [Paenibacillus jilunlii]|uniref:Uncharacterized protein n=1 Tax=Paenibacillus jilunlii TaxID=682956 RepID=A0A1G9QPI3_9BACL|nr:hypothetical protein SAMN05216191_10959 [Paenibacillus jilunlii]
MTAAEHPWSFCRFRFIPKVASALVLKVDPECEIHYNKKKSRPSSSEAGIVIQRD